MFDEIVDAMKKFQDAKYDLMCAEFRFDYAHPDFFEIANTDLTIAQEKYENASRRLRKLCSVDLGDEVDLPQFSTLY